MTSSYASTNVVKMMSLASLAILLSSLSLTSAQSRGYLSGYAPDCTDDSRSLTSGCMAAMHRLCVDQNLGVAAYPQEFGPNSIAFMCIDTPYYFDDIHYGALPGCEATAYDATQSTECYSYADQLCHQETKAVDTVGIPQEFGHDGIGLACVPGQWYWEILIGELEYYHPGCTSPTLAQNGACMAATHRYCVALGNGALGGLIVELGPGIVSLMCITDAQYVNAEYYEVPR